MKQEIAKLRQTPTVKDYVRTVEKLRALSGVKPFEGDNTALSGMSNAESAKIISDAKKRGRDKALERVSALVDGITTKTRKIITEAGLETPETIAAWNEKYEHYVPLHRDEVSGNSAHPVGQGFNIRGRVSYGRPTREKRLRM
ncbi:hypothetical protein SAMN05216316_2725 [Nitrosovibrio sp. Nv6]|nr:hypothetical protein SAMN05216316_2725 [Nitrosovibrio sp. Nv6]